MPGSEPFRHDSQSRVGVLLCHGFTGSPASMRPWAEYLSAEGYQVDVPRLPGHGTSWQDLQATRWPDWYAAAERSLLRLAERCDVVLVGGLSMGGCLALRLAQVHPGAVAGLVLVNPAVASSDRRLLALPVLRFIVPTTAGLGGDIAKPGQRELAYDRTPLHPLHSLTRLWRLVRRDLPRVTQPVLLFRSATDHVVDPSSASVIATGVSSHVTEVVLPASYHVATLDHDASTIFGGSVELAESLSAVMSGGGRRGA